MKRGLSMIHKKQTRRYYSVFMAVAAAAAIHPAFPSVSGISLAVGPLFEYSFYGQPGVRITAAHERLLNGHPQVMLSYTTSRASWWNGDYVLLIDDILLGATWHFRPDKILDPFAGIDAGYLRFDREDDKLFAHLKNNFARLNIRAGIRSSFLEGRLRPSIDVGYAVLNTSVTFPLFLGFAVCYEMWRGGPR
jgi:hypothetical protein